VNTAVALATAARSPIVSRMSEAPIVHIIDDDESMRVVLDSLLRSVDLQTRTYASVKAFLDAPQLDTAGCLVLDVRMPGIGGLDFQLQLAELGIHLPVILMTGYGDVPMSVRGMKAGAVDFLTKPFRDQDMLDAIAVAIKRDQARRVTDAEEGRLRERFATLSPREQQVMQRVAAGKMNKQVAGDLEITEVTVKIHRGAAMRKMVAKSLADLVWMAEVIKPKQS
jgi:FixJ family two-component response regulator